jgi:hypothetical protein
MANFNAADFESGYSNGMKLYFQVPADAGVQIGDTFTKEFTTEATEKRGRKPAKPARNMRSVFTVTGFGQRFAVDPCADATEYAVRCYGESITTEI